MNAANKRKGNMDDDKNPKRVKKVCSYGDKCYRRNPAHLREFSHPHLEAILDASDGGDYSIPPELSLQRQLILEQLEMIVDKKIYVPRVSSTSNTQPKTPEAPSTQPRKPIPPDLVHKVPESSTSNTDSVSKNVEGDGSAESSTHKGTDLVSKDRKDAGIKNVDVTGSVKKDNKDEKENKVDSASYRVISLQAS